jgi:N-acetylglucosamine malate deacetylase 1
MTVLVIVAHPDDEVLGAGGTIARHVARGEEVHTLFLTDGVGARGGTEAAATHRCAAARQAAAILGAKPPRFTGFQDNRLDGVDLLDVVQAVENMVAAVRPETIYTHHAGDLNIDHAVCHRAVLTACRPLPGSVVRRIYAMEVVSSTEWALPGAADCFFPNRFVDVSTTLQTKQRALGAYAEEMRSFPHPRSHQAVEALAHWRGAMAGVVAAEAFATVREIET